MSDGLSSDDRGGATHESGEGRARAETRQCLDPVWGLALNGKHLTVRGGLPVVFAPVEEEERAFDLVRQGDDGAFMTSAYTARPELEWEERVDRARATGGLTEEPAVSVGALFDRAG